MSSFHESFSRKLDSFVTKKKQDEQVRNIHYKILRKQMTYMKRAHITVGPYLCDKGYPLAGLYEYLNNFMNAALWP